MIPCTQIYHVARVFKTYTYKQSTLAFVIFFVLNPDFSIFGSQHLYHLQTAFNVYTNKLYLMSYV